MAIVTVDMRIGRTDEQKKTFAAAILDVVSKATEEPRENIHVVLHENCGVNMVENARHLPEFGAPAD
ncbi:tautomerase family protein [Lysobacter sp. A6]|uniref:Tautomerase family protein n=1 Tax=Noviluteimonas lactosilytica TaxID=2888523 RepID=A0ABS8JLI0_9GAMM|nr:tautomerase family protein [Lysobacter lactosilyticus]MCC8364474.1 tautomerase family protein [Lysobacter lactosilyticus]